MHHLTCGISSLLHSVNLILFTLLLVHLILHISFHHSHKTAFFTELSGHWRLFVLVSCTRSSLSHSAFESTLNSSIVSYPALSHYLSIKVVLVDLIKCWRCLALVTFNLVDCSAFLDSQILSHCYTKSVYLLSNRRCFSITLIASPSAAEYIKFCLRY